MRAAACEHDLDAAAESGHVLNDQLRHRLGRRGDGVTAGEAAALEDAPRPLRSEIFAARCPRPGPSEERRGPGQQGGHRPAAPTGGAQCPAGIVAQIRERPAHGSVDQQVAGPNVLGRDVPRLTVGREEGHVADPAKVHHRTAALGTAVQDPITQRRDRGALPAGDQVGLSQVVADRHAQAVRDRPGVEQLPTQTAVGFVWQVHDRLPVCHDQVQRRTGGQTLAAEVGDGVGVQSAQLPRGGDVAPRRGRTAGGQLPQFGAQVTQRP